MTSDRTILVLNGPGLHDEGEIQALCQRACEQHGFILSYQTDDESGRQLQALIQGAHHCRALVINPAGLSSAARTQLAQVKQAVIEVHLDNFFSATDNVDARTPMQGPLGDTGFIAGLGVAAYQLAINTLAQRFSADPH